MSVPLLFHTGKSLLTCPHVCLVYPTHTVISAGPALVTFNQYFSKWWAFGLLWERNKNSLGNAGEFSTSLALCSFLDHALCLLISCLIFLKYSQFLQSLFFRDFSYAVYYSQCSLRTPSSPASSWAGPVFLQLF